MILALKVSLVVWAIGRGLSAMFEQTSALEKLWDVGMLVWTIVLASWVFNHIP